MSMQFGLTGATEAPSQFTFNLDPNSTQKKKDGKPFKPCPRTDCIDKQTKHAHISWRLKEAKEIVAEKEGLLRAKDAQIESFEQRLQAAHNDLKAYDTTVPQLEARYIEEKRKNANYEDLEIEHLELTQIMESQTTEHDALVANLRGQIVRLTQQNDDAEDYIKRYERSLIDEQAMQAERKDRVRKLEDENRELKFKQSQHAREVKEVKDQGTALQNENDKLKWDMSRAEDNHQRIEELHAQEKESLQRKIVFEKDQLENFRSDAKQVRIQAITAEEKLARTELEVATLTDQLKVVNEQLETVGGVGRGEEPTKEQQEALNGYIKMAKDLIAQVQFVFHSQDPSFSRKVNAYTIKSLEEERKKRDSASGNSTTSASSSEVESPHDEEEEKEEDLSADLQLIHRARRLRGDLGTDVPGKPIIQVREVEVIREVHVPGPKTIVKVPGPIQYVDREVPIPGPTVYVNVPGEEVPGPIRYTPFRVFAHNPIICWLLVEFNFLILFLHWTQYIFRLLSFISAVIPGGPWPPPSPDYASSSSDTDSDVAGAPPRDADRPPRSTPGVFSVLFRPKPGRIPSAWNTLWGLAFHIFFYSTLWLFFSVWQERELWLAENEGTRRWLHQVIAQRGSNGFLGMNQILPQTINRRLDILRYDFMELVGIPVTYQFPG